MSNTEAIEKLANKMKLGLYNFPIKSIDGIPVTVTSIYGDGKVSIRITTDDSVCYTSIDEYGGLDTQTPFKLTSHTGYICPPLTSPSYNDDWIYIATDTVKMLNELRFDKFDGKLKPPRQFNTDYECMSLFDSPAIILDYDKCCVCFEPTMTKTICNHTLCIPCHVPLKECFYPNCPLCREEGLDPIECNHKTKLCPICRQPL